MYHYRSTYLKYLKRNSKDKKNGITCSLCEQIDPKGVVDETPTMYVIKNRVAYDMFDYLPTTGEHFMIVPKRHVVLISDFTEEEMLEHMKLVGKFEKEGFNAYARTSTSIRRSQAHQHTHLIKLINKPPHVVLSVEKLHLLLKG